LAWPFCQPQKHHPKLSFLHALWLPKSFFKQTAYNNIPSSIDTKVFASHAIGGNSLTSLMMTHVTRDRP
jgi:hypothetical protein